MFGKKKKKNKAVETPVVEETVEVVEEVEEVVKETPKPAQKKEQETTWKIRV